MTIEILGLTVNDLQPYYYATIKDSGGNPVDLSSASIVCTMKLDGGSTPKVNRQAAGITIDPDQINNKGQFYYAWQSGDTDTAGLYNIEFEVTLTGGKITFPNIEKQGKAQVRIRDGQDSV